MSHRPTLLRKLITVAVLFCGSSAVPVLAQSTGDVVINLTVKTKDGSTVEGLQAEHFSVSVDKVHQQIVSFETSGLPASIGV